LGLTQDINNRVIAATNGRPPHEVLVIKTFNTIIHTPILVENKRLFIAAQFLPSLPLAR